MAWAGAQWTCRGGGLNDPRGGGNGGACWLLMCLDERRGGRAKSRF